MKKINRVLVSAYNKSSLLPLMKILNDFNVEIISTGGTKKALEEDGIIVSSVESITKYPSILGGRVKTLHPKIFGGILRRNDNNNDILDLDNFDIPQIDMVIIDLYPFEETVKLNKPMEEIIEKIDIGGVALIRASAKNYKDVLIVPSVNEFDLIKKILLKNNCSTSLSERLLLARKAFNITSHYEVKISEYFDNDNQFNNQFKYSNTDYNQLRYGENPHQTGVYYGDLQKIFSQLNGKHLSYNNLLDLDSAVTLMDEFEQQSFGILKHNNACGFASDSNLSNAYKKALAGDPISAFGGVLITNGTIDISCAKYINTLFCEILIAPGFSNDALELLKSKKNRIILKKKNVKLDKLSFRTILNGVLCQEKDLLTDKENNCKIISNLDPSEQQMNDLLFASKICKHTKSNTIVLVKDNQLLASGCGQTSRVDALNQAIQKASHFGFKLDGAVMASDAFFPFPDCVEIAGKAGIKAIIQPGGSKNDQLSIDYCNNHKLAMIFTGIRHFKH